MNIFYLSRDPATAAAMHADIHVNKMILESAQLLCTAHHVTGGTAPYKKTHENHPCAKWVRQSAEHYRWVLELAKALGAEYTRRYGRTHKTVAEVLPLLENAPSALPLGWAEPPQAMPEEFRSTDTVESYRRYYLSKAATMPLLWGRAPEVPTQFNH
jgi:hypothetical protein